MVVMLMPSSSSCSDGNARLESLHHPLPHHHRHAGDDSTYNSWWEGWRWWWWWRWWRCWWWSKILWSTPGLLLPEDTTECTCRLSPLLKVHHFLIIVLELNKKNILKSNISFPRNLFHTLSRLSFGSSSLIPMMTSMIISFPFLLWL